MKLTDLTGLARPLDPRYRTNLAIVIVSAITVVVGGIYQFALGNPFFVSAIWGIIASFGVFFAWALGREIDPDYDLSAFVAVFLAFLGFVLVGLPEIPSLFFLLVAIRSVNRTFGIPVKLPDQLLLLGLAIWLTLQHGYIYGAIATVAYLLDAVLPTKHASQYTFAIIAIILTDFGFFMRGNLQLGPPLSPLLIGIIVAVGIGFGILIRRTRQVKSVSDFDGQPLTLKRVQAAQALGLLAAILISLVYGLAGLVSILPLWAAILGTLLYRLYNTAIHQLR